MQAIMAKKPHQPSNPSPGGRKGMKYIAIPDALWERLKAWADADERSVSWAGRKAIERFLDQQDQRDASEQ
jgi:hypothetical protein